MGRLSRSSVLPESDLPDVNELLAEGERLAKHVVAGRSPFLEHYKVLSESEYKRERMADGAIMFHAQVGYRSIAKTQRAFAEIYQRVGVVGYRVDRYGICLDWSMGYPAAERAEMPQGTGLILDGPEDFIALTQSAPVAPHFGDFVIGTPAALENTSAALLAGATSIGNLGQYFNFRMPRWSDDVRTTAETVKAIALCAAQPVEVLIHSNLDDGFAALFIDMASAIGAVLIERYIVDDLIGGHVSHCYGHTFSDPVTRMAFQRALARVTDTPGSMVYGNTTIFVANEVENYANLASYLLVDIIAQRMRPTGHGINPVPVTEAIRIPEIEEIVEAHLFANRLNQRAEPFEKLIDMEQVDLIADRLIEGGIRFKSRVLNGLIEMGIDTNNPFEMLLVLRRIGAKKLEQLYGPGEAEDGSRHKRVPVVPATTVAALEAQADEVLTSLSPVELAAVTQAGFKACVSSTDVHEYGKILIEIVLERLGIEVCDAGVSSDADHVARIAKESGSDFVAISTYSGVALSYLQALAEEMARVGLDVPVFIGGKLNQILDDSESSLPVDVIEELQELGAIACHKVEDMLDALLRMARELEK